MEALREFILNNYIWVIIGFLILIFTLIGYLVDKTPNKKSEIKTIARIEDDNKKVKTHPSVEAYTSEDFDDPLIK